MAVSVAFLYSSSSFTLIFDIVFIYGCVKKSERIFYTYFMTACTMFLKIFTSLPGWQLFFSRSNGEVFNLHTKEVQNRMRKRQTQHVIK